jgi:LysR family transcriptional regulator, low CO2-responsive transcriptional regulator
MDRRELLEADGLRAFAVFAEHRNFTAAAAALHLSQPSLHAKIRKLSTGLGLTLYQRDGRRLVLTAAGQRLAAFAADGARRADAFLADLHAGPSTLTVAAGRGAFRWVIAEALRRTSAEGHRVRVLTANRDAALTALTTGTADVAVIAHDPPPRQLDAARSDATGRGATGSGAAQIGAAQIGVWPQVLVVDAAHPLAGKARVRLAELAGLELVVPPPERPHRQALERALLDAGVPWQPAAEADGWDLLVHFVTLGIGATVVNGCVQVPPGLAAVPIADLPPVRYWLAWRHERHVQPPDILRHLPGPR